MDTIRVGKISSLNYEKGLARVTYSDRDDAVTKEIPLLTPYGEYYMPEVDDLVYILHLPNGGEAGIILGRYWTKNYTPAEGAQGLRRKDLSREQGKCYWKYTDPEVGDGNDGTLEMHNDDDIDIGIDGKADIKIKGDTKLDSDGTITVKGATKVEIDSDGTVKISGSAKVEISGGVVNINGSSGDVKVQGVSLTTHTHNCTAPGSPSGPPIPT